MSRSYISSPPSVSMACNGTALKLCSSICSYILDRTIAEAVCRLLGTGLLCVGSLVDQVSLGEVYLRVIRFSPDDIIPS
jgi:hypothetical protein